MRVCSEPGCPELVGLGVRGGRCVKCRRQADRDRGGREDRGYGSAHQVIRAEWQRRMNDGETVRCHNPRCLDPGIPVDPKSWHLGHDEHRNTRGPEHPACNLSEAGRASHGPTA